KQNLIYLYLLFYSAARFFIEFLRGDEYRGFFFALSTSQIISILILCVVVPKVYGVVRERNRDWGSGNGDLGMKTKDA
ncbi:MAG: prolipoprotein diacylglyceryl transferase, partial [Treponema sp.]|nr:prolipoprotein diacylglyceryl transferase [Treponema sp.]